ncbi:MAG: alkaline phosphatase family protein [Actinomycetota bacterium]|nr:alkaline phosphatase family protein [Actinomycetota bacterium]
MPDIVLGPLLRYVGERQATVWVETDAACTVEVLGARAPTFTVHDRHYALVVLDDLEPGTVTPYAVALDGRVAWPPPDSDLPPSVIRTLTPGGSFRLAFGSCRLTLPAQDVNPPGHGVDVLRAVAERGARDPASLPDLLLLLGDQIYADEISEDLRPLVHVPDGRSDPAPPDGSVADFEEYARLYGVAWGERWTRWLLSTVPTAMMFDDHDVRDDWNTSQAWRAEMLAQPWWSRRIGGALATYWIYQHLGNLTPDQLAGDDAYAHVRAADGDVGGYLDAFAEAADREPTGNRWSYARDVGDVRVVILDTRCARVVDEHRRSITDAAEWDWVVEQARGARTHLLIGSSLPWLLPRPIHDVEVWNEAVCGGAWGRRWAGWGERIRQGVDLEHWAAFRRSFEALSSLLCDVIARPDPPASVVVLSGDVHYSYLADARFAGGTRVWQVVSSPLRNPLAASLRWANSLAFWRLISWPARLLALAAGVPHPRLRWQVDRGPWFDNALATIETHGRSATVRWERSLERDGEELEELGSAVLA